MIDSRYHLLAALLCSAAQACDPPPPTCDAGSRYFASVRSCVPRCEAVFGYETCYGADGQLHSDGSYDGPVQDVATSLSDVLDASIDATSPLSCDGGQIACLGQCVSAQSDPQHCGACGRSCPTPRGAIATCEQGDCRAACRLGFEQVGMDCEPRSSATAVSSGQQHRDVSSTHAAMVAVHERNGRPGRTLSRPSVQHVDRAHRRDGTSTRPTDDLPSNRVVFWRLRGRIDAETSTRVSRTWQFRTGLLSAAADTAHGLEADFNGDGFSDLGVGNITANSDRGSVSIH
jgi:hypothetical protein